MLPTCRAWACALHIPDACPQTLDGKMKLFQLAFSDPWTIEFISSREILFNKRRMWWLWMSVWGQMKRSAIPAGWVRVKLYWAEGMSTVGFWATGPGSRMSNPVKLSMDSPSCPTYSFGGQQWRRCAPGSDDLSWKFPLFTGGQGGREARFFHC